MEVDGKVTLSFWIKYEASASTAWRRIVCAPLSFAPDAYTIILRPASNRLYAGYGGNSNETQYSWITKTGSATPDVWQHIAMTYDGTVGETYINGVPSFYSEITGNYVGLAGTNLWIGGRQDNSNWFNGKIDDVRIFDRALSEQEIQQLYDERNGVGQSGATSTGTYIGQKQEQQEPFCIRPNQGLYRYHRAERVVIGVP